MSIIIRLQNLPWSANSVDIRRYFSGLSIPEGGVHIVGGEMGDAFIAFSTDEDARLAMAKDGGKIKDMQIKLLLSSRAEMMRVIEQARQQNLVVQPQLIATQPSALPLPQQAMQPPRIMTPLLDSDRRRGRSPSPHRRSREKSPGRDRRRSPDRRSSKRDRSRSPSRSSRGSSRDLDRRGDRFKRDERRYDDPSRYRDDRRSPRDFGQEPKKYPDADHVNSRSQLLPEGFRDIPYDQLTSIPVTHSYPYNAQQAPVTFPAALYTAPSDSTTSVLQAGIQQNPAHPSLAGQRTLSSDMAFGLQLQYQSSYDQTTVSKESSMPANIEQQYDKPRRRTRFEPEYVTPQQEASYAVTGSTGQNVLNENSRDSSSYNGKSDQQPHHTESREVWPHNAGERSDGGLWNDKRPGLLDPPSSKSNDFVQVVPMDLDPSPSDVQPENGTYSLQDEHLSQKPLPSYLKSDSTSRNDDLRRDVPNRGPSMLNDYHGRGPSSLTLEVRRLRPDTRMEDILEMFRGIPLPPANVRIQSDAQGTEKAFVRFLNVTNFEEALSRNHHFVRDGLCELIPCPDAAFDSAPRSQKPRPKPKPRDEDLCVQLRGLPFSCKEDDVVRLFDGLGILDMFVDIAPDGRATGVGFVEFGTPEDFRAALAMNGKMIGHRYITISVASKEMMAVARGEEYIPHVQSGPPQFPVSSQSRVPGSPGQNRHQPIASQNRQPPSNQGRPPPPANQGRPPPPANQGRPQPPANQGRPQPPANQGQPQPPTNQVRPPPVGPPGQGRTPGPANQIRPPGSQSRPPQPPPCISMRGLPEGVTNRDIADFFGQVSVMPRAIHIMLRPDKMPSGDAFAELGGPRDYEAALDMDGKPMLGHRISVSPITFREMSEVLKRPSPLPPPPTPGPLLRTPGGVERPRRPLLPQGPPADGPFRERPRMEPPRGNRPLLEPFNRMEPPGRPPFGRMRGPWPNRPFGPKGRFPPPPPPDRGIKDFGSPGCVVSINNLHFGAGLEELLDFFRGYNLTKDSVIRKYNENGQTTGEARVAFQNPRDAQRAIRELNQKPIMGRPLTLSLL